LGLRAEGLQHMLQAADRGHDEAEYVFGILTFEYNNSPMEVEEALVHVDKFITAFLADPAIRRGIRSMCYDVVLTLIRYEELRWGHQFFHPMHGLPHMHVSMVSNADLPKCVEE
jgi:hypothetical protein